MKHKILMVEDDEDLAYFTSVLLKDHNYDVDIAYNSEQALTKIKHQPDLILLDRTLPDTDGLEICRQVRDDKRFRGIPIIILSGKGSSVDKVEGLYVGADDYITKPYVSEELIARIKVVMRRLQFGQQLQQDNEELISELKRILDQKLITPMFQPIFSLTDYSLLGFEVLSRSPRESSLSNPEILFRVALSSGLYFDLEMLCWQKAFAVWSKEAQQGQLFLNCSPYLIESGQFSDEIFRNQGIDEKKIILELSERVDIQNYGKFFEKLEEFKKTGLQFAVDDVGCGFASLNTIAEVRPQYLKIDLPLIRSIHEDILKQDIVRSVVDFGRRNHIRTIAEGIEYEDELRKVIELGVDAGQGYLLARPAQELVSKSAVQLL